MQRHFISKKSAIVGIIFFCFINLFISHTSHISNNIYQTQKIHTINCIVFKQISINKTFNTSTDNQLQQAIIKNISQNINKSQDYKCNICQFFNLLLPLLILIFLALIKLKILNTNKYFFNSNKNYNSYLRWLSLKNHSPPYQ